MVVITVKTLVYYSILGYIIYFIVVITLKTTVAHDISDSYIINKILVEI